MEIVNVLDTQEGQSIIEAQTQHIANEINGMIMADIMRECYYQGCFRNGMLSEWKRYCKFRHWKRKEERYSEKLYVGNDGKVRMYHYEYSWKPSKFLLNIRLFIDRLMCMHIRRLENKLVKFNPEDYYNVSEV